MYLKPKISPESTKYVEAEHEKEEGDNRKAENINQPLIGLYIFRSSCICQVFLLMMHLFSISLWRKKAGLTQNRGRPLWLAKDPCHQGDQCPPDTKNCEGIISESLRSFLIFITGQSVVLVCEKKNIYECAVFFSFCPLLLVHVEKND